MRGSKLRTVTAILVVLVWRPLPATGGETLYNGIVLPDAWPPRMGGLHYDGFRNGQDLKYHGPMAVPYLEHPPAVAVIDIGRQLFVDDFLIQNMNLKRTYHRARYHPASPVIAPEEPWEQGERGGRAMVNSDGVWFDPGGGPAVVDGKYTLDPGSPDVQDRAWSALCSRL